MKQYASICFLLCVLLAGCSKTTDNLDEKITEDEKIEQDKEIINEVAEQRLQADPSVFHFIADWLTDTEILYVEKNEGKYEVKSFNIESGQRKVIFEDDAFVINVWVHPSQEYLLIHTSDQYDAAIVKMLSLDGRVLHEIEIASTELEVQWNSIDPQKILFTAFHEDWSFDIFAFDGHLEDLKIVNVEDPFPKWFGEKHIVAAKLNDHPLDGARVERVHVETGEREMLSENHIVYMDTFKDSILFVEAPVDGFYTYKLQSANRTDFTEWKMPAVSNYSEWVVPEIEWINETTVVLTGSEKEGQLDDLAGQYSLYLITEGQLQKKLHDLDNAPLKCSPSGNKCLIDHTSEELVDMETSKRYRWIEFTK
ncbi:hypothetical protein [Sporosarcina sp. OR05]|uniref:YqgU-like beta propeller domain-containing protein n=1 Tax=Sporosarcina sp. OR05 TaxID=2969819 RepID=UPI00352A569C